jgi:hypothetical protein
MNKLNLLISDIDLINLVNEQFHNIKENKDFINILFSKELK